MTEAQTEAETGVQMIETTDEAQRTSPGEMPMVRVRS
jgi:hypothetical protein